MNNSNGKDNKKNKLKLLIKILILAFVLLTFISFIHNKNSVEKGSINHFETAVEEKTLEKVIIKENVGSMHYIIDGQEYKTSILGGYFNIRDGLVEDLNKNGVEIIPSMGVNIGQLFSNLLSLSILIMLGAYIYIVFSKIGKANLEFVKDEKTRFSDIGGFDYIKEEIMDIVGYLKDPEGFKEYTKKIPKGILLEGDPGNGKTLLARAIAGESKTPFFQISGADIEGSFVAQGASRIKDIFERVRKEAKEHGKVILFIDELDTIGMSRNKRTVSETNQTINKLLTELDGFNEETNILVIGATNLASALDKALVRPGRFDRIIKVPMPNFKDRKEILTLYLKQKKEKLVNSNIWDLDYITTLSRQTEGFSGASLFRIINDAALLAYNKKGQIDIETLRESYLRVVAGLPNGIPITSEEEKVIAYHEAAHAVASMVTSSLGVKSVAYGTIRSYGQALGHIASVSENKVLNKKTDLYNRIKVLLAGRAIEDDILDGDFTTGASNDLMKVNQLILSYIAEYGMSPESENLFIDPNLGDLKAPWIQEETKKIRERLYHETKILVSEYRSDINLLANYLLENKEINQEKLIEMFGEKFPSINEL